MQEKYDLVLYDKDDDSYFIVNSFLSLSQAKQSADLLKILNDKDMIVDRWSRQPFDGIEVIKNDDSKVCYYQI